jgi:eukaryotic-like serine/threonine-protein kinase
VPSPTSATTDIAGRYRLEGPLGRGGMAEVLAGTDLRLQRPVAVKFLLPEMSARADIRRRFEAEACSAASFSDPHAVAVFDTGEHEGRPYIVMERLPGETLADRILTGPQDPAWVRQVAREVLGALGAAHAVGLVHRDVKPGNILITADDHAKIADFGIAKSLEATDGSLDLTGTGQLLGTPAYVPPERLDGSPATPQSDLYSLGVVLYEALAGECPFPGDTPMRVAMAIVAGDYRPLHEVRPGVDPALVAVVERAMAANPAARFESAAAMAAALSDPAATVPLAGDITTVQNMSRTAVLDRSMLVDVGPPPPPVARRRSRVPVALLIGLVFVAVLVAALNRRDDTPTNQPASAQTEATQPSTTAAAGRSPATTVAPVITVAPRQVVPAPAVGNDKNNDKDDEKPGNGKAKGKDD